LKTVKIQDYRPHAVKYVYNQTHFTHNIEHDYQIVLLKEDNFSDIKQHIEEFYRVVTEYDLIWTRKHLAKNKQRLGIQSEVLSDNLDQEEFRLKALIFEIESPEYQLTSAGAYHLQWTTAFTVDIFDDVILKSNNIEMFFYCATLLIGPELLNDLRPPRPEVSHVVSRADLVGADGWDSFHQMFSVTNICSDWLVLRNADVLPDNFWGNDKDIDILCRDRESYISAVNATKRGVGISSFEVIIESRKVDVDARFLSDDYYDRLWQEKMLSTKEFNGVVPLLNLENYFFSLLYHARIHKSVVKPIYVTRLAEMANSLGFKFNECILSDDRLCAQFMDSYLQDKGYRFTYPYDYACYQNINRNVTRHLVNIKPMCFNWEFSWRLVKHNIINYTSKFLPQFLKENLKRVFNR
jgi:hypothetical protein